MTQELLIGCGHRRDKLIWTDGQEYWEDLTTLDINPDAEPDVEWDLNRIPLPFDDNSFDEIHAYEVLEHVGSQGDFRFFFDQFADFWRILRPGGVVAASVPAPGSPWVWGDPSHTRHLPPTCLAFLDQDEYRKQVGVTAMSDFRRFYKADFVKTFHKIENDTFFFVLTAIKPARL